MPISRESYIYEKVDKMGIWSDVYQNSVILRCVCSTSDVRPVTTKLKPGVMHFSVGTSYCYRAWIVWIVVCSVYEVDLEAAIGGTIMPKGKTNPGRKIHEIHRLPVPGHPPAEDIEGDTNISAPSACWNKRNTPTQDDCELRRRRTSGSCI